MVSNKFRLQVIPPNPAAIAELGEHVSNIVNYFTNNYPSYECVGVTGKPGVQGGALHYREVVANIIVRHIVIKYFDSNDLEDARQEEAALTMLKGKEHIINMMDNNVYNYGGGYGIMMEYMGFGTVQELFDRLLVRRARGDIVRVPERFLWSIFLCLVRACIGMSFPEHLVPNNNREGVPQGVDEETPRTCIEHKDIFGRNILISGLLESLPEHTCGPLLKLIDFGSAVINKPVHVGYDANGNPVMDFQDPTAENIYQAAFVVMCLAADDMDEVQGWKTFGTDSWGDEEEEEEEELEEGEIRETKPRDPWEGDLDRHKRSRHPDSLLPLLQRCMGEPKQAPSLRELVVRCDLALYTKTDNDYMRLYLTDKTKDFYGFAIYETNEYLQTFIRENILDATVDPLEVELLRRRTTRKFSMPTMPLKKLSPILKRRSIG